MISLRSATCALIKPLSIVYFLYCDRNDFICVGIAVEPGAIQLFPPFHIIPFTNTDTTTSAHSTMCSYTVALDYATHNAPPPCTLGVADTGRHGIFINVKEYVL